MKKLGLAILAAATLIASCTKMDVAYEQENEIGFAPASKKVTKAAMEGTMPTTQNLSIWAYWNGVNGSVEDAATYANYTDQYLNNAEFESRTGTSWGGANNTQYPWPTNGALVFAGYNRPKGTTTTIGEGENQTTTYTPATLAASYDFTNNTMTFTGYTQSNDIANTFDLCWFGRTAGSYNNRVSGSAVPVTLNHALTWITIQIKGDASVVNNWKVTSMTLQDVYTTATGVCSTSTTDGVTTNTAAWSTYSNKADYVIGTTTQEIYTNEEAYESTENGIVVIPQEPANLYVTYEYAVAGSTKTGYATIPLTLTNTKDENNAANTTITKWASGKHYTYTLVFKANEILVAPSYGTWGTPIDNTITVE